MAPHLYTDKLREEWQAVCRVQAADLLSRFFTIRSRDCLLRTQISPAGNASGPLPQALSIFGMMIARVFCKDGFRALSPCNNNTRAGMIWNMDTNRLNAALGSPAPLAKARGAATVPLRHSLSPAPRSTESWRPQAVHGTRDAVPRRMSRETLSETHPQKKLVRRPTRHCGLRHVPMPCLNR